MDTIFFTSHFAGSPFRELHNIKRQVELCLRVLLAGNHATMQGGGKKFKGKKTDKRKARNASSRPDTWYQQSKKQNVGSLSDDLAKPAINKIQSEECGNGGPAVASKAQEPSKNVESTNSAAPIKS